MDRSAGKKIALYASIGIVLAFAFIALRGFFDGMDTRGIVAALSDAFLIPAVLLAGISALSWVRRTGEFDSLGYGVSGLLSRLPFGGRDRKIEKYYDYKQRKEKERGEWEPYSLWVAGVFAALALFFLGVYFILGQE
jgi:hypothetical protein